MRKQFHKNTILYRLIGIFLILQSGVAMAQTYPPTAVVTMPFSNAYFRTNSDVEIHVYATDIGKTTNNGTVTRVEFFANGVKIGETSTHDNRTYKFIWGCVPAGEHRITARATNSRGVTFTSVGVLINVGNATFPSQGLAVCKGKYMAGLHQYQLIGNWDPYFNGITAENSCKWGSIEGTRNNMNWSGADAAYNAANSRKIMFRWHAAMWASQYPSWLFNLSTTEARAELVQYMEGIAARYKYVDQIDVLNEQLFTHQRDNQRMRDVLSGKTNTAVDDFGWQIWLFTEARRIFPNTKLVLNDYGLEGSDRNIDEMLKLVAVLRDRGLIDGFGTQAHWFSVDRQPAGRIRTDCSRMARGGVPVYVTELDLCGNLDNNNNEQQQLASFQTHFPEFWEHPDVKGITWWGHVLNRTWVSGTGFTLENGQDRAAGTWLKQYMNGRTNVGYPMCPSGTCAGTPMITLTSPAVNATYSAPASVTISANATASSGSINNVQFYNGTTLLNTDNTAPYSFNWINVAAGNYTIRAVATSSTGSTAETSVTIKVNPPRGAYNGTVHPIPGTIQAEHFDVGGNGIAYLDNTPGSEVTPVVNFRIDEDVDIENCTDAGGGYNIGYATAGEWLEYTVNVTTAGVYNIDFRVAVDGTGRTLSLSMGGTVIANNVAIPNTTGWQVWQTVTVNNVALTAGQKIMRLTIGATDYVNINYVRFTSANNAPTVSITAPATNSTFTTAETVTLTATAADTDGSIASVAFYDGTTLLNTDNTAPYSFAWSGMTSGVKTITAVATDNLGATTTSAPITVTITGVRAPFNGTAHLIPGRIEAEEYDLGGQGIGYNEANTNGNQGGATLRNDEVDIEATQDTDGEYNIGYTLAGEWLSYSVNVSTTGIYTLEARVAKDGAGGLFHIEIDGQDISGPIAVPNTGGWQVWESVLVSNISLTAGPHIMRVVFDTDYMNLNYVAFDIITAIEVKEQGGFALYPNPFGSTGLSIRNEGTFTYSIANAIGNTIEEGKGIDQITVGKNLQAGVYVLTIETQAGVSTHKITKQ